MAFLELSKVNFSYLQQSRLALTGIDINLDNDGITAIIGPNGSGKTTLTKLMAGIIQPTAGEICLKGRRLQEYSLAAIGQRIGYIFQNPDQQLFCSTVKEEIGFGLLSRGCEPEAVREKVKFYLEYFELAAYRNVFPLHLSQGEKRRLALAAILINEPEFLILDEPTVGLDAYRKKLLAEYLKKIVNSNKGIIIVSHDLNFVMEVADRIIDLEKGRIRWDSLQKGNVGHEA